MFFNLEYFYRLLSGAMEVFFLSFLFFFKKKKRKYFPLRILLSLVLYVGYFALISQLYAIACTSSLIFLWKGLIYFSCYSILIALQFLCYQDSFSGILLSGLTSLLTFGITSNFAGLFFPSLITLLLQVDYFSGYGYPFALLIVFIIHVPFDILIWFFFAKDDPEVRSNQQTWFVLILMIIAVFANSFLGTAVGLYEGESSSLASAEKGTLILLMSVILFVKRMIIYSHHLENELDVSNHLLYQEQKQYSQLKENLDVINIKCHDIKHFLKQYGDKVEEAERKEIESSIQVFDSTFETKNPTINTIVNEKNYSCIKNNIRITVFGDASALSYIHDSDMFSLLGNALDNAIEAEISLPEEKKCIQLIFDKKANYLIIELWNYFQGSLEIENDLPKTTKQDNRYHGFGVLSMKTIVKKYQGQLLFEAKGDMFILKASLPLQK